MWRSMLAQINAWVVIVAIGVAGMLLMIVAALMYFNPQAKPAPEPAQITIISAPTATATLPVIPPTPTATPPEMVGGLSIGMFVQISGTEGAGLRLREGAGTSQSVRLIAMDSEVFQIKEGPIEADDFIWWRLEASYDADHSGWAVSQYLSEVVAPQP